MSQVRGGRANRCFAVAVTLAVASLALHAVASHGATGEEIEASGVFHLGDNDSRLDGRRLALLEAKRNALEKAGTYIESITEVSSFQLTRDQIRSYTAGILELRDFGETWEGVGANSTVTVTVRVRVDKNEVARQLAALRKDVETTRKLEQARAKIEHYEQEITGLNRQLQGARGRAETDTVVQQAQQARSKALTGVDVTALLAKASAALTGVSTLDPALTTATAHETPLTLFTKMGKVFDRVEAESILRDAVHQNPNDAMALAMLGFTLGNYADGQREYEEAIRLTDRAIQLKPDYAPFHINRGTFVWQKAFHAFRGSGRDHPDEEAFSAAMSEFYLALRLAPELGVAHLAFGDFIDTACSFYFSRWRECENAVSAAEEWRKGCRLGDPTSCDRLRGAPIERLFGCGPGPTPVGAGDARAEFEFTHSSLVLIVPAILVACRKRKA